MARYSNRSEYRDNYSRNSNQREQKKHSGAKFGNDKNGKPYVSGWNYSRRNGLVSFLAVPYNGTSEHQSKSGKTWLNVMVKVNPSMSKPFITSGLMDMASKKVIINELGIVMNPNAPRGGYCGKFGSK